jgi:hypothetical protein
MLALAGAAVLVVATVLAVRAVTVREAVSPRVIEVIRVGGDLTAAAASNGSVWVGDFAGRRVVRLAPDSRRQLGSVAVSGQPVAISAGDSAVWVRAAVGDGGIVARLGTSTRAQVGFGSTLAVGRASVWAADVEIGREGLHRIVAGTGRDAGLIARRGVYALATGGDSLWAMTGSGTVLLLDDRTGEIRARWPALATSSGTAPPEVLGDATGAWVMRVGQGADSEVIRLEGGQIVRRLPLDPTARPLLAQVDDALWTVTEDAARHRYAAMRLNPGDGAVTARISLGTRNATDLLAVGDDLWVTSSDGTVTVIGDH